MINNVLLFCFFHFQAKWALIFFYVVNNSLGIRICWLNETRYLTGSPLAAGIVNFYFLLFCFVFQENFTSKTAAAAMNRRFDLHYSLIVQSYITLRSREKILPLTVAASTVSMMGFAFSSTFLSPWTLFFTVNQSQQRE